MADNEMTLEQITSTISAGVEKSIAPLAAQVAELKSSAGDGAQVTAKVAELETQIKSLKEEVEKKKSSVAAEWEALRADKSVIGGAKLSPESAGDMVGKIATSIGLALKETGKARLDDKQMAVDFAKKMYPEDKGLHGVMQKDLEAGIPAAGGYGIPQILLPDYIKYLYANTILEKVGATKYPMPNGNLRIARNDTAATISWGGELPTGNKTQEVLGDVVLNAKKLTALVPISNSLLRQNAIGIDSLVSQDLQRQATIALDNAAFNGLGNSYQPLGLANTTGIWSGTSNGLGAAGSPLALTPQFPMDILKFLELANVPMLSVKWVMNPLAKNWLMGKAFSSGPFAWANEMNMSKTLASYPFISSSTVYGKSDYTEASIWLGDFSEFIWGVAYDMALDVSREGTYTSGGTTYSAFQRDETFIRLVTEHDFNVRHPVAFANAIVAKGS